jgi:hypothetical protein
MIEEERRLAFPVEEPSPLGLRVFVTHSMKFLGEYRRPAEEL